MTHPWRARAVFSTALLLSLLAGCHSEAPRLYPHALVTPSPTALPPVDLVDAQGKPFTIAQLAGSWAWLYFGFARCPDVCPAALGVLAKELDGLPPDVAKRVKLVFISIDPARDTPAKLGPFVAFYSPKILAATGRKDALDTLAHAVGAAYVVDPPAAGTKEPRITHSNLVFVVDPTGHYVASYAPGAPAGALAADTLAAAKAFPTEQSP